MQQDSDRALLQVLFDTSKTVKLICNFFAQRKRKRDVLLRVLVETLEEQTDAGKNGSASKSDVIKALKDVEACAISKTQRYGRYIEGRHGHESRYQVTDELLEFCRDNFVVATVSSPPPAIESPKTLVGLEAQDDYWAETHIPLREGVTVVLRLPKDLTEREASKLAAIIQHLYR